MDFANPFDGENAVSILPKSNTLLYSVDEYRAQQDLQYSDLRYLEDNRRDRYLLFGEDRILPNGPDNNFPINYKNLLDQVYIGHGLKRSLINLLLSGGVGVYREVKEGQKVVRDWLPLAQFPEVSDWLDSWDFQTTWLPEAATDLIYLENMTTVFSRNRGARIGNQGRIAGIGLIPAEESRLEYTDLNQRREYIYQADWTFGQLHRDNIIRYPVFEKQNPFAHAHSAAFYKMPTFASFAYGRPPDIGATELLRLLAILPNFHRANLTEKPFRWVVSFNSAIFKQKMQENKWTSESKEYKKWKSDFIAQIDSFLYAAKGDKVQTRFITEFSTNAAGITEDAVKITKLEDDTKTLSETGLSLWDSATIAIVSANAIHPQLANIHLKNHALSGSNLREAYDLHIRTSTPMMRTLLLDAPNTALKINWPNLGLKLGFMDVEIPKNTTNTTATNAAV